MATLPTSLHINPETHMVLHWTSLSSLDNSNMCIVDNGTMCVLQLVTRKWTFKIKLIFYGSIACYKASLVAYGFYQQYGIDYQDTFSLLVCIFCL